MGLMSDFRNVGKMVQETLNNSMAESLEVDGKIGNNTIGELNNIPENKVDKFMDDLKEKRLEYLQRLPDWEKYGDGWTNHTNAYCFGNIFSLLKNSSLQKLKYVYLHLMDCNIHRLYIDSFLLVLFHCLILHRIFPKLF